MVQYGELILQDAIRFSKNRADAEDAYQRSLEILLTKAPTTDPNELVPWIRVVVRREATTIARSNHNRTLRLDETVHPVSVALDAVPDDDLDEKLELEMGADALRRLTTDQIKCLVAQSEGLTYDEIAERTGFTRRKVSRCLQDGRLNFARSLGAISAGSECERMQPLISRLFESDSAAAIELRPHLRHCLACRERVRRYESAPRNAAALFPPTLVVVGMGSPPATKIGGILAAVGKRFASQTLRAERWMKAGALKKAAFGVAFAAAVVGGGLAIQNQLQGHQPQASGSSAPVNAGMRVIPMGKILEVTEAVPADPPRKRRKRKGSSNGRGGTTGSGSGSSPRETISTQPQTEPNPRPVEPESTNAEPIDDGSAEFLPETR